MQQVEDRTRLTKHQHRHLHRLKSIKGRYADGEPLTGSDARWAYAVLTNHPRAKQKIGVGVRAIFVHQYIYASRCLFVLRTDGTIEDFSAPKIIRGTFESHSAKTLAAMARFAFGQIRSDLHLDR